MASILSRREYLAEKAEKAQKITELISFVYFISYITFFTYLCYFLSKKDPLHSMLNIALFTRELVSRIPTRVFT